MGRQESPQLIERKGQVDTDAQETNRASKYSGVSNLCRKLGSDQCRQALPIVGSWHVNLFLLCFDGGQVPKRCLVSKFMSSIKCFGLLPQVHTQQGASLFWLSQSSRNFD